MSDVTPAFRNGELNPTELLYRIVLYSVLDRSVMYRTLPDFCNRCCRLPVALVFYATQVSIPKKLDNGTTYQFCVKICNTNSVFCTRLFQVQLHMLLYICNNLQQFAAKFVGIFQFCNNLLCLLFIYKNKKTYFLATFFQILSL